MSRYIDSDKLQQAYKEIHGGKRSLLIDTEPTADVRENVKGEWRTTYFDHVAMGERPKILYCSVCNQCIAYPTNYCPNCGADMRGES